MHLSLTLYFLRHGETIYSKTGGYCGDLDPELISEGAQMARAFADAHRSTAWTSVYASPMKRTVATAKPLCDALGLEMQLRDGLKEIRYGKWEDKSVDFVKEHYWEDISVGSLNRLGMRRLEVKPLLRFPAAHRW